MVDSPTPSNRLDLCLDLVYQLIVYATKKRMQYPDLKQSEILARIKAGLKVKFAGRLVKTEIDWAMNMTSMLLGWETRLSSVDIPSLGR